MSSHIKRSHRKRKSDAVEGIDETLSQPSKQAKTHNATAAAKPRKRTKARAKKTTVVGIVASKPLQLNDPMAPAKPDSNHDPSTATIQESDRQPTHLTLSESIGDIFAAPANNLIIHACNTEGSWGAGIAAAFKSHYPAAYEVYHDHCHMNGGELWRKALLIPPQPKDDKDGVGHFIGCLFTSRSKGRKKDSPAQILKATEPAMKHLMKQAMDYNRAKNESERLAEVRMCKINSGLFHVPWAKTKALLEDIEAGEENFKEIKVISREE